MDQAEDDGVKTDHHHRHSSVRLPPPWAERSGEKEGSRRAGAGERDKRCRLKALYKPTEGTGEREREREREGTTDRSRNAGERWL